MDDPRTWLMVLAMLLSLAALVKASGKTEGTFETRIKALEDQDERFHKQHAEHSQHARDDQDHHSNMDLHWTPRERTALTVMLANIEKKLDLALERRSSQR